MMKMNFRSLKRLYLPILKQIPSNNSLRGDLYEDLDKVASRERMILIKVWNDIRNRLNSKEKIELFRSCSKPELKDQFKIYSDWKRTSSLQDFLEKYNKPKRKDFKFI